MSARCPACHARLSPNRYGIPRCRNLACTHNAQAPRESEGRYGGGGEILWALLTESLGTSIDMAMAKD